MTHEGQQNKKICEKISYVARFGHQYIFRKPPGHEERLYLPVTEKTANKGLWFPSGEWDGSVDIERVIQATKEFFE